MSENSNEIKMEAFFTKAKSEEGIKVELPLPNGTSTNHFLIIRGHDSETYLKAQAVAQREQIDLARAKASGELTPEAHAVKHAATNIKMISSLVKSWSFEQECKGTNVAYFLENAPAVCEKIDAIASQREHFFEKPSTN